MWIASPRHQCLQNLSPHHQDDYPYQSVVVPRGQTRKGSQTLATEFFTSFSSYPPSTTSTSIYSPISIRCTQRHARDASPRPTASQSLWRHIADTEIINTTQFHLLFQFLTSHPSVTVFTHMRRCWSKQCRSHASSSITGQSDPQYTPSIFFWWRARWPLQCRMTVYSTVLWGPAIPRHDA